MIQSRDSTKGILQSDFVSFSQLVIIPLETNLQVLTPIFTRFFWITDVTTWSNIAPLSKFGLRGHFQVWFTPYLFQLDKVSPSINFLSIANHINCKSYKLQANARLNLVPLFWSPEHAKLAFDCTSPLKPKSIGLNVLFLSFFRTGLQVFGCENDWFLVPFFLRGLRISSLNMTWEAKSLLKWR